MKKINLAIVGATGMVGTSFLKILQEREIKNQIGKLFLFASKKNNGTKATQVVRMLATTGRNTKETPFIAASSFLTPEALILLIFSATTIASSTTIPMTIIIAASVMLLTEYPIRKPPARVKQKVNGIPMATHTPDLGSRNIKRTASTMRCFGNSKYIRFITHHPTLSQGDFFYSTN